MKFHAKPAAVVEAPVTAGALDLVTPCRRAQSLTSSRLKFTLTGPHMLSRTLWNRMIRFLNSLRAGHFILEMSRRSDDELAAPRNLDARFGIGIGVIDVKTMIVEAPGEIARRIERAETILGRGRVRHVHPDCGFWMLKRSIADGKIEALVKGRNKYLNIR